MFNFTNPPAQTMAGTRELIPAVITDFSVMRSRQNDENLVALVQFAPGTSNPTGGVNPLKDEKGNAINMRFRRNIRGPLHLSQLAWNCTFVNPVEELANVEDPSQTTGATRASYGKLAELFSALKDTLPQLVGTTIYPSQRVLTNCNVPDLCELPEEFEFPADADILPDLKQGRLDTLAKVMSGLIGQQVQLEVELLPETNQHEIVGIHTPTYREAAKRGLQALAQFGGQRAPRITVTAAKPQMDE